MLDIIRIRHGLFWPGKYPPFPCRSAAVVALCAAAYALIVYVDDLEVRILTLDREVVRHKPFAQTLFDCMNGASGFYFPDTGKAFECRVRPL